MKRTYSILAALSLMMISAVSTAHAQNPSSYEISIPFAFVVENQTMPAGEYRVAPAISGRSDRILLRSRDGQNVTTVLTLPVKAQNASSENKLVFNRYGERYFLSQIWTQGATLGRELLISRDEQEAANKNGTEKKLAVLAAKQK